MNRMLEALRQIRAKSADKRPDVSPVSPEELEAFGLRQSGPGSDEPRRRTAEPARSSETATSVGEPGQAAGSSRTSEPTHGDASVAQSAVEPGTATRSGATGGSPAPPGQESGPLSTGRTGVSEAVTEVVVSQEAASQAAEMAKTDRGLGGLRSLIDEHSDQYAELADNVLKQVSETRPAALMFTSVADGEGKTSTLASLAVMLAERLGEDVVLVDADVRSPTLASLFGVRAECGLVDVLTGAARWPDAVQETGVRGLSLLCGGRFPTHDGTPPDGVDLAPVLEALQRRYPIVLVDTASLGHPEVAPMSKLCQGTYLVVRLGQTSRRAARRAVRLITRCGGRVLGCVLTDAQGEALGANASGR